jgi:hypothetical protein
MDEFFRRSGRVVFSKSRRLIVVGNSPAVPDASRKFSSASQLRPDTLVLIAGMQNIRVLHQAVGSQERHSALKQKNGAYLVKKAH